MNTKCAGPGLPRCLKRVACWIAFLPLAALLPATVYGLGSAIPNQNAEAIARGNAFIASADNASAIYYNPAAITQLEGTHLLFGAHNLVVNPQYESTDGSRSSHGFFSVASVPQFYATYSQKDSPLSFGVGLYAPFGLGVHWPTNTSFNTLGLQSQLTYIAFNPVVAYEVCPSLSLAVGPTINYAKVRLRQGIGLSAGDEFVFNGTGWCFGATAGLLWKPIEKWSVGVDYRSPTSIKFAGRSTLRPYAPSESTDANLNFPQSIGGGISYRPTPQWNFEAYLIWTDWDTIDGTTFRRASGNIPFALNWISSVMTGVGGTRYFDNGWFVSAGYFFSQHSTPEKNFTPLVPDTDLHVGSIGFGRQLKNWSYSLSAQLITGPWRDVNNSTANPNSGQTADGKWSWFNESVNFSVGYRF